MERATIRIVRAPLRDVTTRHRWGWEPRVYYRRKLDRLPVCWTVEEATDMAVGYCRDYEIPC